MKGAKKGARRAGEEMSKSGEERKSGQRESSSRRQEGRRKTNCWSRYPELLESA